MTFAVPKATIIATISIVEMVAKILKSFLTAASFLGTAIALLSLQDVWTDCRMIFNDAATLNRDKQLSDIHDKSGKGKYNTDQFMKLDAVQMIGFVTAIYVEEEQKLRKEFEPQAYVKKSLRTFDAEIKGIISTDLSSFKSEIVGWKSLVPTAINGESRARFEQTCNAHRVHFGTVQRIIVQAKEKLIVHYHINAVYIPIILIELNELRKHTASSLINQYSQQFELQFHKDGADTALETKLITARSSRLRFPTHTAFTAFNNYLEAEATQARVKLPTHDPDSRN